MYRRPILVAVMTLALVTIACGVTINIPVDELKAGPTKTDEINIPLPDASSADINLAFGAGNLVLNPGAQGALISGTATYNLPDLEPKIVVDGAKVRLETGNLEISGFPKIGDNIENKWDLALGSMPLDLTISAGAYKGEYNLGDLALKSLEINDGAADVRLRFSEPNQVEMNTLRYMTGASNVKLQGLANANFTSMIFRSGAGDYTLDFSGELQRDAVVMVESGISRVVIIVPEGVSTRLDFEGGLANVDTSGGWKRSGDRYIIDGSGPTLTINVDLGAGNLVLRTES